MRPIEELETVLVLIQRGLNNCQIVRMTGIPLTTVRRWRVEGRTTKQSSECSVCRNFPLEVRAYAYLFGLYLGDGHIVKAPRTYRLSIYLDDDYTGIIEECVRAMALVIHQERSGFANVTGVSRSLTVGITGLVYFLSTDPDENIFVSFDLRTGKRMLPASTTVSCSGD